MPPSVEFLGYFAAVLTTGAFAPQVFKSLRTRSVRDLSLAMLAAMATGNLLWLAYGVAIASAPLAAANAVTLALVGTLLALKLREVGAPAALTSQATGDIPRAPLDAAAPGA